MRNANWPRIISWIDFGGTVGDDSGTHHTFLCGKIFNQEKKTGQIAFIRMQMNSAFQRHLKSSHKAKLLVIVAIIYLGGHNYPFLNQLFSLFKKNIKHTQKPYLAFRAEVDPRKHEKTQLTL